VPPSAWKKAYTNKMKIMINGLAISNTTKTIGPPAIAKSSPEKSPLATGEGPAEVRTSGARSQTEGLCHSSRPLAMLASGGGRTR